MDLRVKEGGRYRETVPKRRAEATKMWADTKILLAF